MLPLEPLIGCLPDKLQPEIKPTIQVCTLTGNQTRHQLSHNGQGSQDGPFLHSKQNATLSNATYFCSLLGGSRRKKLGLCEFYKMGEISEVT